MENKNNNSLPSQFQPFKEGGVLAVIGVGLISGSFALMLKEKGIVKKVIGVSRTKASAEKAIALGIIDEALTLEEAVSKSDLIYVAIPVDVTIPVMKQVMDLVNENQIVVDAGSTKDALCESVRTHPMRKRFVASHPMWGTENSGPEAAVTDAFIGRACVICEKELSDAEAVTTVENIYRELGMHITYMNHTIMISTQLMLAIFLISPLLHLLTQFWKKKKRRMPFSNSQVVALKAL
jgi:prephenate dehydrogenase